MRFDVQNPGSPSAATLYGEHQGQRDASQHMVTLISGGSYSAEKVQHELCSLFADEAHKYLSIY